MMPNGPGTSKWPEEDYSKQKTIGDQHLGQKPTQGKEPELIAAAGVPSFNIQGGGEANFTGGAQRDPKTEGVGQGQYARLKYEGSEFRTKGGKGQEEKEEIG